MSQDQVRVIYLCNAIDQQTKFERSVTLDSPAATNKVFGIARALKLQGIDIQIVSLGKGKQLNNGQKFQTTTKYVDGIPVHYAAFWQTTYLTHIIASLSLATLTRKNINKYSGKVIVIAYNRLWQYLPSLIYAKFMNARIFLDLEDAPLPSSQKLLKIKDNYSKYLFTRLCSKGSIIVAKNISNDVLSQNTFVCYGTTEIQPVQNEVWSQTPIKIMFGGTLVDETGVLLLMETILYLESIRSDIKNKISITITGQGALTENLQHFCEKHGNGWIIFLGTITQNAYLAELKTTQVGLNLRLSTSEMGKTTFPSKILEYASHGLAIITTRVSDVPELLDSNSAIFVDEETPQHLAAILQKIADGSYDLQELGKKGQEKINSVCGLESVGKNLTQFLLKEVN